jgi:nitrilase
MSQNRVACIQMTSTADLSSNLLAAQKLIRNAAEQGAQLIVLPENFALMGANKETKLKTRETLGKGPIQNFLSKAAAEHHVWIIGGTIPIAVPGNEDKIFASCLMFNDQGERVAHYNKIHLFDVTLQATQENYFESETIAPGDEVVVVPTPFGKIGLAICYDVRFPEMFRLMQKQGAEIFVLPSAFTYTTGAAHWDVLIRARAIENLSFMLAAGQVGQHDDKRKTYGHSMIVNPWGEIQICLPESPGVVISELNMSFLNEVRKDFPVLTHRKI